LAVVEEALGAARRGSGNGGASAMLTSPY
jgi:hypothetical protein